MLIASETQKSMPQLRDSRLLMVLLYVGEFYLLSTIYDIYIFRLFEYEGFDFDPDTSKILISLGMIVIFVLATPARNSVRSFYLNFLLTTYFVPSMILYSYSGKTTSATAIVWGAFAVLFAASAVPITRPSIGKVSTTRLLQVLSVIVLGTTAAYPLIGGLSNFNLNIAAVYEFRREAAAALPSIFGYLSPILGKVIIPFCTAIALVHRRYGSVMIFVALAVLHFGFTSHKDALFAPFAIIVAYLFLCRSGRYSVILAAVLAGLIVSLVDIWALEQLGNEGVWGWYTSLFVRRVLMIPPLIDHMYFDFFSKNIMYYWSNSRITLNLFPVPYDGISAPFVIGEVYFHNPDTSANAGFIGAGYAQAGVLGVLMYSAGLGLVLALFESFGKYMGLPFTVAATIVIAVSFTASDLLTLFVTHGLGVLIILLMLMLSPEAERQMSRVRRSLHETVAGGAGGGASPDQ